MTGAPPRAPTPLAAACKDLGIATTYQDAWGKACEVPEASLQRIAQVLEAGRAPRAVHVVRQAAPAPCPCDAATGRWQLDTEDGQRVDGDVVDGQAVLPANLPLGYHALTLPGAAAPWRLIVCPERCHAPPALNDGARWWGPVVQVYALRSARNWGLGDFTDLARLVELAAAQGAAFVGINPLHALFPGDPDRASPYSPSSRIAVHPLYLDLEAMAEFGACEAARERVRSAAFQARLLALRDADHVDHAAVAALKREVARLLFDHFTATHGARQDARAQAFQAFQERERDWLPGFALFDAVTSRGLPLPPHGSDDATAFAVAHADDIAFAAWLQWQCDEQLGRVAARATACGMPLGLYRDLAVGVSDGGAETWSRADLHATGFSAGAPPEPFNPSGQSWGLPPPVPSRLVERAFAPFAELLTANMRHAGALRLDHAMALQRLFWVPVDGDAGAGTYVDYPFDDLLNVLALESVRHRCLVIGEDLGNVPAGFREALQARGVFSYCPLYFESAPDGSLPAPDAWKADALAVVGTHDLPPWRAWWRGDDIVERTALGLFPDRARRDGQVVGRAADRVRLLLALEREGLVADGASLHPESLDIDDPALGVAVHTFIARTPARLLGVQLEDVLQQHAPVNLPGTDERQRPNWRIKLPVALEALGADPRWRAVTAAVRQARGSANAAAGMGTPPLGTAVVPSATYRIQFHAGMRFEHATRIVPYLASLGASHLYASPYLRARAGSTHGYDVVDHNALNPEVGTADEHAAMCAALARHGLSQLVDIVPNHMGVLEADNAWWLDVLECGPASVHAETFDIEWHPAAPELDGQVLLPVLGDHYGRVLEAGELRLVFEADRGSLALRYHGHRFPLDPRTYPDVFDGTPAAGAAVPAHEADAMASLMAAFGRLPPRDTPSPGERAARARDKVQLREQLADACRRLPWVAEAVAAAVDRLNGTPGTPSTFDALDLLIGRQAYRLAFWRVAGDDVNYRRFFDITTLAAVRMERPDVFAETHRTVFDWIAEGHVTGLRIDHPDGLADPQAYFAQLQARHDTLRRDLAQPPRALYVSVEKILAEHEQIASDWAVHGGTGYRFSNQVNGLFVDGRQEAAFDALCEEVAGEPMDFERILRAAKFEVMTTSLASDLQWLAEALYRLARADRTTRDFTRNVLRDALMHTAAGFSVYRTYIGPAGVHAHDRQELDRALADARRHIAAPHAVALDFLQAVILGAPDIPDPARRTQALRFVARWQQFTAPVMAKSMEDTAFYRYHRLVSLNDVGGEPRRFGTSVAAFHAANATRARFLPHTLLGTSTHDSKRSEDVRARIDVLSERPEAWREAVFRWRALNAPRAERAGAAIAPNDEYLLYQTLVGVWPLAPVDEASLAELRERVQAYMLKAVREAKQRTSWIAPDEAYERALAGFVDGLLGQREPNPFLTDFAAWVAPVQRFGCWNSLNQVVFKLTSPGVPDIYQGSESWHFALVDPDNRRPVDFAALARDLAAVQALGGGGPLRADEAAALVDGLPDGRLKVLVTTRLLALRQQHAAVFRDGAYVPLHADGPAAAHVVAYARTGPGAQVVVVGSRLLSGLAGHAPDAVQPGRWRGTTLPVPAGSGPWTDALTGAVVPSDTNGAPLALDRLFTHWPMAVLVRQADAPPRH